MMEHPNPAISLALELSSRSGSVGLGRNQEWLGEEEVRKDERHHDDLMPAIKRLFDRFGYRPTQLSEIFVSIGPGGFTGIRLAVTTAKMLSFATGAKIIAVPTGLVVAEDVKWSQCGEAGENAPPPTLIVALATKRGVSWCSTYEWHRNVGSEQSAGSQVTASDGWVPCSEPGLLALAELLNETSGQVIACLDGRSTELDELVQRRPEIEIRSPSYSAASCWRAAERLARLDSRRPARSAFFVEPANLTPCYGRKPEAVRLWEVRPRQETG